MRPLPHIVFSDLRGMNTSEPATRLQESIGASVVNVLLERLSLGRRRPSLATVSLTSGPTLDSIVHLYSPAQGDSLIAFSGTGSGSANVHRLSSGSWTNLASGATGYDAPNNGAPGSNWDSPQCATFNNKVYIAYNTTVNRLHLWDGADWRRVGIEASSAPTAADTGSGSYTATLRYYKVLFKIVSGDDIIATSELSAALSFTPSGSGTHARVTKPTTPDSATHWQVFGSADGINYYALAGEIAVGTTTYDDNAAPSSYSAGTIAATAGLFIPPPSCKYLLAAWDRLFMAGRFESRVVAHATLTAPRTSRVWYTDVKGSRDNVGEEESVPNTVNQKNWIDCGDDDGDDIVGLAGPLDGAVYVFKTRSIWRLTPTGNLDAPLRADRIYDTGTYTQNSICMGEDGLGNAAIYFTTNTGVKRIVAGYGLEDLSADLYHPMSGSFMLSRVYGYSRALWDPSMRTAWFVSTSASFESYAFQPAFEERTPGGVRGGWTQHDLNNAGTGAVVSGAVMAVSSQLVPVLGGTGGASTPYIATLSGNSHLDIASVAFTPSVTSRIYQPAGLLNCVWFSHPVLEWHYPGAATSPTVSVASVIGGPLAVAGTFADTITSATYSTDVVQEKLESIQLADAYGIQATVTWDTAVAGTQRPRINALIIPVWAQEGK